MKDILRKVREKAETAKDNMTADEFFQTNAFEKQASALLAHFSNKYVKKKLHIAVKHDSEDKNVAFTTSEGDIVINTANDIAAAFDNLYTKYLVNLGVLFHEIGHQIFNDFDADMKVTESLMAGNMFGEMPTPKNHQEEIAIDEIEDALQDEDYRPIITTVYSNLSNILADPHDEEAMMDQFGGGLVTKAIKTSTEGLWGQLKSLEALEEEKAPKLAIIYSLLLQFCRFGEMFIENESNIVKNEAVQKIYELAKPMELAKYTDDLYDRYNQINIAVLFLWPYIKEELKKQQNRPQQQNQSQDQNQQNQNQSQNSQSQKQQAVQNVMQQLGQGQKNSGASATPQSGSSSSLAKKRAKAARSGNQDPRSQKGDGDKQAQASFEKCLHDAAQAKAEAQMQKEITNSTNMVIQTVDQNSCHAGRSVHVIPQTNITNDDIARYDKLFDSDLKSFSKRLQKEIEEALRDLVAGSVSHHKQFGRKLDAGDTHRQDCRCWSNKKQPQDLPDMAIAILVDHSGSMSGERISTSMKASMLLYDFATALGIPVMVAGHNVGTGGINLFTYTDFNKVNNSEKYRLAKMGASSCNRDGMAIEVVENLLSKRPEEAKLFFIISDGQPNDTGYGGQGAFDDIRSIIRKYEKLGISAIALAIGDDKDRIEEIYGSRSFVNISNLDLLPKTLAKICKQKILATL